jgi:translocation and assembly module TamB
LQFQGTIPVTTKAPASLLLLGNVDLRLAQLYDPSITSSGQLRININSYGQTANPNVEGRVDVVNANFTGGSFPVGLQDGNGVLTLTKDRLNITQFTGKVGSGTITASGGVVYRPSVQFDLGLKGNGIRVLLPQGIRTGVDTELALTGNTQSALLSGQMRIDQLSFAPDFDLMNVAGQLDGATTLLPTQGFSQALQLNIALQSTSNINLVSRTISIQGAANLNVRGTAARPVILGRVNLSGGDLIFGGNRYVMQGGTIEFVDPSRTNPVVNVSANTTIQQYNIAMQFRGPVDHLHISYSSDPALPPADIISLIAFGKTSEATIQTAPGALGAESLIASQVSSQLTSRVEKIAGISQLSIDPVLGGSGQTPGARIAIQQRVTSKIFVTFATDVTSTQREAISVQYQQSPRLSFSGTRDQNGGFAFDTRIRKTW